MKKLLRVCMFLLITTIIFANGNTQKSTVGYESENDRTAYRYVRLTNLRTNISEFDFKNIDNIKENQIREISTKLVEKYSKIMRKSIDNISFSRAIINNGNWYVTLQENYLGIPVLGSKIKFKINKNGDVNRITVSKNLVIKTSSIPIVSKNDAIEIALQAFKDKYSLDDNYSISSESERLYYYPQYADDIINVLLSYRIVVKTEEEYYKIKYFIDAHNGEILGYGDMIKKASISGAITWQYYPKLKDVSATDFDISISSVDVTASVRLPGIFETPFEETDVNFMGNYYLPLPSFSHDYIYRSEIREMSNSYADAKLALLAWPIGHDYPFYNDNSDLFYDYDWATPISNAYYHMNKAHDYFINTFNYTPMNYQMKALVNSGPLFGYDGASADGTDITIYPPNFKPSYAFYSDVIYHEYAHNVVHHIYGDWIGGDGNRTIASAMDETFADYFAAVINNDAVIGENLFNYPRNLVNNYTIHDFNRIVGDDYELGLLDGDDQMNGLILGRALWDIRSEIGSTVTDELVFNTLFNTPTLFSEFCECLIEEEDDEIKQHFFCKKD